MRIFLRLIREMKLNDKNLNTDKISNVYFIQKISNSKTILNIWLCFY